MNAPLEAPPAALPPVPEADAGRPLQDLLKVHCYGCGALNERGLQIKSCWEGDTLVCRWTPKPHHIGPPGHVYGGLIASVVDCHAIWAAIGRQCREAGVALADGPPPFVYVTGRLTVNYLKPTPIDGPMVVRARVVEHGPRKSLVHCEVRHGDLVCATAEVIAVRVARAGASAAGA